MASVPFPFPSGYSWDEQQNQASYVPEGPQTMSAGDNGAMYSLPQLAGMGGQGQIPPWMMPGQGGQAPGQRYGQGYGQQTRQGQGGMPSLWNQGGMGGQVPWWIPQMQQQPGQGQGGGQGQGQGQDQQPNPWQASPLAQWLGGGIG